MHMKSLDIKYIGQRLDVEGTRRKIQFGAQLTKAWVESASVSIGQIRKILTANNVV